MFYLLSLNWGWSDVFLFQNGVTVFQGEYLRGEVTFSSHHIKGTYYQHYLLLTLTLIFWPRWILQSSSALRLFFSLCSLPYYTFWKGRHYIQSTLKRGQSHLLEGSVSIYYLEFFCMENIFILPTLFYLIHLLNCLYQQELMHIYFLFCLF